MTTQAPENLDEKFSNLLSTELQTKIVVNKIMDSQNFKLISFQFNNLELMVIKLSAVYRLANLVGHILPMAGL